MEKPDYIYKLTIKELYGPPESWIARLGGPDKVVPNPHCRSKSSYLYLRARVEAFIDENRSDYEVLLAKRAECSRRAKTAANTRAAALVEWARSAHITIGTLPGAQELEKLTAQAAIIHALERNRDGHEFTMTHNAIAAYVRHNMTNYEDMLLQIEGKPGCHEAYLVVRERVDALVATAVRAATLAPVAQPDGATAL